MIETNFIGVLDKIGDKFVDVFSKRNDVHAISTPDYGWFNVRYSSQKFRVAHVEKFIQEKFAAIHVCVFPNINDPSPIFGFDIISGKSKITGLFYDLSPIGYEPEPFIDFSPSSPRNLPDWGEIFSKNFVACKPSLDEIHRITDNAIRTLNKYLDCLQKTKVDCEMVVKLQNKYCSKQKMNQQTFNALKHIVGEDRASEFMHEVLFPEIKTGIY